MGSGRRRDYRNVGWLQRGDLSLRAGYSALSALPSRATAWVDKGRLEDISEEALCVRVTPTMRRSLDNVNARQLSRPSEPFFGWQIVED